VPHGDPDGCPALPATRLRRLAVRIVGVSILPLVGFAPPSSAQSRFDSWTTENGLPQNSVNDIVQTRDGYLWLATYGGLARFDGWRFVVFDRSTEGIGSQRIRLLHEDRRAATLWASTEEGMLIRYRDGRFTTFGPEHGLPPGNTMRIEEDDEGRLWITTADAVVSFDGERAVRYVAEDFPHGVRAPKVSSPYFVWWSYDSKDLHVLLKGHVESYPIDLRGAAITSVTIERSGNLWVRTDDDRVLRVSRERTETYGLSDGMPSSALPGHFQTDRNGSVWFGEFNGRISRIRSGRAELMSESGLLALLDDREGSTWLGTSAGLHRLRNLSFTTYSQANGLTWNWVYTVLEDRHGAMWFGTWGGGLYRYQNGRFLSYRTDRGRPAALIAGMYEDRSGRLWVGTNEGLGYVENGSIKGYNDPSGLLRGFVWAIHEDWNGALWFGTDNGLVRLKDGELSRYTVRNGLSHDRVISLYEGRSGALWIGTFQGLTRFADGRFVTFTEREGLVGSQIRALHEDHDGILWVGTYDSGLYRLADGRLTRFTRREGLHDNGVFQILEDDNGYLWMGSNRGISRVRRADLNEVAEGRRGTVTPMTFGIRDGLLSIETNGGRQPAGWKSSDGRLWFPTMGGAAVVDPAALSQNTAAPTTLIEELEVAGQSVSITDSVTVPPDASSLTIRYTAPSFARPEQIRFRYRLAGLDDHWIEVGDARTATYHRTPPGTYEFTVVAANHQGVWGSTGRSVRIVVLPPFWRTWWFATLAMAALFAVALTGHEVRVRRMRRDNARQAAFSRQLIESQELERRRIAGELHDSVGQHLAIIRQRARTGRERWAGEAAVGQEFDAIAGVADQIDRDIKDVAHGLRPYQLDTIGLAKILQRMVGDVAESCGIECAIDIPPLDDAAPDVRIHVYRIVQECLSNIVKHSRATRVDVAIRRDGRDLDIHVQDNGVGFAKDVVDSSQPARGGFGLMGIRERARILGGRVDITSAPGRGTVVSVRVTLEPQA
jgi:signal transduction histidine kinase/ligand-binding sensor domain-containing protein